jgi:SWI/SNF-related matrix-associated actin-dependent regulator of chromatin subfamily A-like protein 1
MPHQIAGGEFLAHLRSGLLYWDQGAGKTYAAVHAADIARDLDAEDNVSQLQILVLCPAVARRNWAREIDASQTVSRSVVVMEKSSTDIEGADVIVCSYDLAARGEVYNILTSMHFSVLILDELQYLKNPRARRTQAVFGFRGKGFTSEGISGHADQVWALSGTPAPNHIGELFPWVKETRQDLLPGRTYDDFLRHFCKVEETPYGIKVIGNNKQNVEVLWSNMSREVLRVRKQDVLDDLPPIRFSDVEVEGRGFSFGARAALAHIEKDYADKIEMLIDGIEGRAPQMIDHVTTLRRVTEAAKVGDAVEILTAELSDKAINKVVVFANFIDNIDALTDALEPFNPVVVHGSVSGAKRQDAIDRFMSDPECRVFIGQVVAAGTAITLHANGDCQDVMFLSADWVPANNAQAVARVWRKGAKGSIFCRFLKLNNSLDEQVQAALMRKTRLLSEALGEEKDHHAS